MSPGSKATGKSPKAKAAGKSTGSKATGKSPKAKAAGKQEGSMSSIYIVVNFSRFCEIEFSRIVVAVCDYVCDVDYTGNSLVNCNQHLNIFFF